MSDNNSASQLVDGRPVPEDGSHTELKPNGQQKGYVVLSPEERAKGFVRPYRDSYVHVGKPLRGEMERLDKPHVTNGIRYTALDRFYIGEGDDRKRVGRYLSEQEVAALNKTGRFGGCGALTTMSRSIAETYAREPGFYNGTFCVGCRKHLPLDEFVWDGTDERVGS